MNNIPAYMRIREHVVDLVFAHPDAAAPIMSERELCAKFGVTRPTARRALKDLIDDGWLKVRPGLGMFVNPAAIRNHRLTSLKRPRIVLLMNDGKLVDLDPFHIDVLANVCAGLKGLDASLKLVDISNDAALAEELAGYKPDGVLWMRPPEKLREPLGKLRRGLPVHCFGDVPTGDEGSTTMDYREAGRLAAAWFLDQGRRRVAFVGGDEASPVRREVFSGWAEEFAARGTDLDKALVVGVEEDIAVATERLLAVGDVEGGFCFAAVFAAMAGAFARAGVSGESCPMMVDENHDPLCDLKPRVAAKLILFPPELSALAAQRLHTTMTNPGDPCPELVLEPSIEEIWR